jgi:uncharacterized protein
MGLYDDARVLITGASAGLGAEFARQLAGRAKHLILAARRVERLEAIAREIARPGLTVTVLKVDLTSPQDTDRFLAEVKRAEPAINIVINNAGLGDHGLFEDSTWTRIDEMIAVNVRALTQVAHAFVKDLIARANAAILNVSSIASFLPLPQMAVYGATKAYVTSFSEALRGELRGTGVRVLALCPGPVDTEFFTIAERPDSDASQAAPPIMKVAAPEVVRTALHGLEADQPRVVPGLFVRTVMGLTNLTPMFLKRFALNRRGRNFKGH